MSHFRNENERLKTRIKELEQETKRSGGHM